MCSGIEKLQLIASSEDQLCSSLAYTCQNKLLDFNLPAKYWVTHKLDYTDHIVNMEFYDAGPVRELGTIYNSLHVHM